MNTIKYFLISLFFIPFFVLILSPVEGFAQNQAVLPGAGLTPENPFYFFDKFGEALQEFFTFNPEGKARLQITFAAERVAEIKIILETKGVEAKGLNVAQARLQEHLADAATIVADQKLDGKDVSALAAELDDKLEPAKSVLEQTFKDQERALEAQERELRRQIIEARRTGNMTTIESLVQQLGQVKAQKELLELQEEEAEEVFEEEEERLEEEMESKEEAEEAIQEAEEDKQEILDEVAEEGLTVPAGTFGRFDDFLVQAQAAFAAGNFEEARRLIKQAEQALDAVEESLEGLEELKEEQEELEEEREEEARETKEKEKELKEEQEEKMKEEAEKEAEKLEKEKDKAREAAEEKEEENGD